jgi:CRISPR-associated protein Cas1
MGIEGDAASRYFGALQPRIRAKGFIFNGRVRRPPTDPVNALLSFAYSMITQDCVSALQGVGLDPYVGFLHQDRPGRPGLALDLIEEFRAGWADRLVLTLINRQQLKPKDFTQEASGAVRLSDDGRKTFLTHYQEKKREELMHPYLNEKVPIGLLPYCQALLLARHLRGDMQFYTPWIQK